MSEIFNKIEAAELATLRKSIAKIAALAAIADDGTIDDAEKASAVKLAQQRTFTSNEVLQDFYKEVDANFEGDLSDEIKTLEGFDANTKKKNLRKQLKAIQPILDKLSNDFAYHYAESQESFAKHVFKANNNMLMHFFTGFHNDITTKIYGEEEE